MFLFKALKKSWQIVKKKKAMFVLLFLIQLIFITSLGYVQVKYQVEMARNVQGIVAPLEDANYNVTSLQAGLPFTTQTEEVLGNWEKLKSNFWQMMGFSFVIFVLINGLNWALSHYMVKSQNLLKTWGRFALVSAIFFAPHAVLAVSIFSSSVFQINPVFVARVIAAMTAVLFYFAWLGFGFSYLNLKQLFRKIFWEVGIKKFYLVLITYVLILLLVAFFGTFFYESVLGWPMWSVFISLVLLILAINFARIFWINSLREIS